MIGPLLTSLSKRGIWSDLFSQVPLKETYDQTSYHKSRSTEPCNSCSCYQELCLSRYDHDDMTHFRFLTFLARDLRGLENIQVYFSFVNVSDSLGPSSEHNCWYDQASITHWTWYDHVWLTAEEVAGSIYNTCQATVGGQSAKFNCSLLFIFF